MAKFSIFYSQILRQFLLKRHTRKISYSSFSFSKSTSKTKDNEIPDDYVVKDLEDLESIQNPTSALFIDDVEDDETKERRIAEICNISRLLPQHRNMLHNKNPYNNEPQSWIHSTLKYNRTMFGRYGASSGIDPRLCFYTKSEIAIKKEYEKVAYPFTLQEMMEKNLNEKLASKKAIKDREDEIDKKIIKLAQWSCELKDKIAKKTAEAKAARERKERLIEEVRRQFGFKMDTRDERFQEMLALKEKEDRKKQKEAKRKIKEEKMLAKLIQKNEQEKILSNDDAAIKEKTI